MSSATPCIPARVGNEAISLWRQGESISTTLLFGWKPGKPREGTSDTIHEWIELLRALNSWIKPHFGGTYFMHGIETKYRRYVPVDGVLTVEVLLRHVSVGRPGVFGAFEFTATQEVDGKPELRMTGSFDVYWPRPKP